MQKLKVGFMGYELFINDDADIDLINAQFEDLLEKGYGVKSDSYYRALAGRE